MASKNRSSGGDFVLESRHLVGLFLLLVVIFGVVFTLGYLMGRSQYDAKLRATVGSPVGFDAEAAPPPVDAKGKAKGQPQPQSQPDDSAIPKKNSDWDFYHSAEPQTAPDHLQPPPKALSPTAPSAPASAAKSAAAPSKSVKSAKGSASADTPPMAKGAVMLQVAAVLHQEDALALAQALQQKKFPAIVVPPSADKYYRVQVGPYHDDPSATKARQDLEAKGFKSIIKR
jgi:cell division septation protein DedD